MPSLKFLLTFLIILTKVSSGFIYLLKYVNVIACLPACVPAFLHASQHVCLPYCMSSCFPVCPRACQLHARMPACVPACSPVCHVDWNKALLFHQPFWSACVHACNRGSMHHIQLFELLSPNLICHIINFFLVICFL